MRLILSLLVSAAVVALGLLTELAPTSRGDGVGVRRARADSDGDPINGRKLFLRENCYICHGGRGGGGMCPSLRDDKPDESDVIEALREGTETGMPSFERRLTRRQMEDIAAYIQTLRTNREPTFTHWWETIPSQ